MARIRVEVPYEEIEEEKQSTSTSNSASEQHTGQPPGRKSKGGVTLSGRTLIIAFLCVLLLILATRVDWENTDKTANSPTPASTSAEDEAQRYYEEVSKFVELPTNETPQILNVADALEVKKDNSALADVKDGDKMLFFIKGRKLVVYRPSTNKIVAAISLAPPQNTGEEQ